MSVPRQGRKKTSTASKARIPEKTIKDRATILVVEDDPNVRTLSAALLSDFDYEVLEATDGPGAFDIGEAVARQFSFYRCRASPAGDRVLVKVGGTEGAIIHQGWLDKGIELLAKPFWREDLAQKVGAAIDGPDA